MGSLESIMGANPPDSAKECDKQWIIGGETMIRVYKSYIMF